jgi:hypothetical protein
MSKAIAKGADRETYLSVQPLIYKTAKAFARRYGKRDFSEVLSEANYYYQVAYRDWDYRRGVLFSTYLTNKIWHGLLDSNKIVQRRHKLCPRVEMPYNLCAPILSDFDLEDFLLDLSEDGRTLTLAVISCGPEWFIRYGPDRTIMRNPRKGVRDLLRSLGWKSCRIDKAFNEVKEALL